VVIYLSMKRTQTQTRDIGSNLAWTIKYSVRDKDGWSETCSHDNFAEGIGHSLFAFHEWIQHVMGESPDNYRVDKMFRVLRRLDGKDLVYAGEVEIKDFPTNNPTVPPRPMPHRENLTVPFDFLSSVPVSEK